MNITDQFCKKATSDGKAQRIWYCDKVGGFGLRVTAAGAKAFILTYWSAGVQRRITIGRYPDWSVERARKRAQDLRRKVDCGEDPLLEERLARTAPTVEDLCRRYLEEHAPRKRASSQRNDASMIRRVILPQLGKLKVADVDFASVDALHRSLRATPYAANRTLALLSKMMSLAIRWGWRTDNPVRFVERNQEPRRERPITDDEMRRLLAAINSAPKIPAAIIRVCLLTGCRFGEAAGMRWEEVSFERREWRKPGSRTKQKTEHIVPLSPAVLSIISEFPRENEWVFGERRESIKKTWAKVLRTAEIDGLRLHDLRHAFASMCAANGWSLPQVGALLGHASPQTTARYMHLFGDALRKVSDSVAERLDGSAGDTLSSRSQITKP